MSRSSGAQLSTFIDRIRDVQSEQPEPIYIPLEDIYADIRKSDLKGPDRKIAFQYLRQVPRPVSAEDPFWVRRVASSASRVGKQPCDDRGQWLLVCRAGVEAWPPQDTYFSLNIRVPKTRTGYSIFRWVPGKYVSFGHHSMERSKYPHAQPFTWPAGLYDQFATDMDASEGYRWFNYRRTNSKYSDEFPIT